MIHYIQGRFNAEAGCEEFIQSIFATEDTYGYEPYLWTRDESEAFVFGAVVKSLPGLFTRVTDRKSALWG